MRDCVPNPARHGGNVCIDSPQAQAIVDRLYRRGVYAWNGSAVVQTSPWSAISRILPYVEQGSLYSGIDFTQPYNVQPAITSKRIAGVRPTAAGQLFLDRAGYA